MIDFDELRELFNFRSISEFVNAYGGWVEESMKEGRYSRDEKWTASIAVGKREFVERVKERLGAKAQGREVRATTDAYVLCAFHLCWEHYRFVNFVRGKNLNI